MLFHVGYGNAAGFLFNAKLLDLSNTQDIPVGDPSSDEEFVGLDPITGKEAHDQTVDMTEEEKEAETEKVLDAMEKLEKTGFFKIMPLAKDE